MTALIEELKQLVIASLELEEVSPADIDPDAPLFGDGLGLDSIDALELGVALQRSYGITLSAEAEDNHIHFANLSALAAFVAANRRDGGAP